MPDPVRFTNESDEYRAARAELLNAEMDLRRRVEEVAAPPPPAAARRRRSAFTFW